MIVVSGYTLFINYLLKYIHYTMLYNKYLYYIFLLFSSSLIIHCIYKIYADFIVYSLVGSFNNWYFVVSIFELISFFIYHNILSFKFQK